jgi:hypothetical protein
MKNAGVRNCRNQAISRFDRWSLSAIAMLRQLISTAQSGGYLFGRKLLEAVGLAARLDQ